MDKFTRKQRSAIPVEGVHNLARVDLLNDTTDMWNQCQILCGVGVFILAGCNGIPGPGCLLSGEQENISSSTVCLKETETVIPEIFHKVNES